MPSILVTFCTLVLAASASIAGEDLQRQLVADLRSHYQAALKALAGDPSRSNLIHTIYQNAVERIMQQPPARGLAAANEANRMMQLIADVAQDPAEEIDPLVTGVSK